MPLALARRLAADPLTITRARMRPEALAADSAPLLRPHRSSSSSSRGSSPAQLRLRAFEGGQFSLAEGGQFSRALKIPAEGRTDNPAHRRIFSLFGPSYKHDQLNDLTLRSMREWFGMTSVGAFEHLALIAREDRVVDVDGQDIYMPHLDRLQLPLFFIAGEENRLFFPETSKRTYDQLVDRFGPDNYRRTVFPDYAHMDCFIGRSADEDIFPHIADYLLHGSRHIDTVPNSPRQMMSRGSRNKGELSEQLALHTTGFSWDTALALARASQLAYRAPASVQEITTKAWGFGECRVFDVGETRGFVCWDAASVLICFRGTESVGDWIGNLHLSDVNRAYGRVHSGFAQAYDEISREIAAALREAAPKGKLVWLTGHGLGGALATVAAAELAGSGRSLGLYTFGQPRTVSAEAAQRIERTLGPRYHRFVNAHDIVARIPPGYAHGGRLVWFGPLGEVRDSGAESLEEIERLGDEPHELSLADFEDLQQSLRTTRASVASLKENTEGVFAASVEGLFPSVADHAIHAYVIQIRHQTSIPNVVGDLLEGFNGSGASDPSLQGLESVRPPPATIPVLLRVKSSDWRPPAGFRVQSRLGQVVTGSASLEQVTALVDDEAVLSIERSRDGGSYELDQSVGFARADQVHRPPVDERGDSAIVGIIDSGVDVLHEAFQDGFGHTRIDYLWNQHDSTGPSPNAFDPRFTQTYGTLYSATHLDPMITTGQVPSPALRDPEAHGTHVASIAAGRAAGGFAGGFAPEARLCVVIPKMLTSPGDPVSIGYSNSHVDALAFLHAAADVLAKPIVVNVSLGMNAGAHDGSSSLEVGCDAFSGGGRQPGRVIVKSAGNERGHGGHAATQVAQGAVTSISWKSRAMPRTRDYIEVWYSGYDDIELTLFDPAGNQGGPVSSDHPLHNGSLGGNPYKLELTPNHKDNGDNLVGIYIWRGGASAIQPAWRMEARVARKNGPYRWLRACVGRARRRAGREIPDRRQRRQDPQHPRNGSTRHLRGCLRVDPPGAHDH